jgi:outer membrane protein OmpA-like peptidoglycan-associated protein
MKNTFFPLVRFIFLLVILFFYQQVLAQKKAKTLTLQHSKNIQIKALDKLNSPQRETNLTISPDGNHLFFMSDRGGQTWSRPSGTYKGRPRFDGDIWVAQKIDGQWQTPNPLAHTINTLNGEDEPSISQDGQHVYFQSWKSEWANSGGPYYSAELDGTHWTKSKGLGGGVNQFFRDEFQKKMRYATDGMSISPDEKTFVVVAGTNYDAPMDIYISRKNQDETWDYCQKLSVSTPKDERSAFLAADGHTLYFASEGYGGFGGLDIFKTTIKADGTHGEVINLGEPFNTNKDDYGFILAASGEEAYFVRNGDIYFANLQEADIRIRPDSMAIVYGQITDKQTKETVKAQIELFLGETEQAQNKINQAHSNSASGMYNMILPKLGQKYFQKVSLKGYKTTYRSFEVANKERFYKIRQDFELEKESSEPKEFKVLFDFDKSTIKQDYLKDLNSLVDFLIQNSETKIKITGHTDNKGTKQYNLNLSQKRMQSVLDFLFSKGIDKSRIKRNFEGEQKPIGDNQQTKGRIKNRRVDIVILK